MKKSIYKTKLDFGYVFLGFFLVIYQILSSIFISPPLLYGLIFSYMIILLNESERTLNSLDFRWYFSLFYLCFIDLTHDFALFSSIFAFIIFYYSFVDWIRANFQIRTLTPFIFVFSAYLLVHICDLIFALLVNDTFKALSLSYLISVLIEACLAYFFFKNKF